MNIEEYIHTFLALSKEDRALYVSIIESKMFEMSYTKKSFYIDDKGLVTLNGSFDLSEELSLFGNDISEKELKAEIFYELPIYFSKVTGSFCIENVPLKSLMGCPERVGGDFVLRYTEIESLEGCPLSVSGDIHIENNLHLKEISFLPKHGKNIYIYDNGVACYPETIRKHIKSFISITSDSNKNTK
jgi:hypothetical protein